MFLGHYALAFAAKKVSPKSSLGLTLMAANFLDLIFPLFVLLGLESIQIKAELQGLMPFEFYYPYSHSLLMSVLWGGLLGGISYFVQKNLRQTLVLFFLVVSHWVLDFIAHRPDMPVLIGGPFLGLYLWRSLSLIVIFELGLFCIGLGLYIQNAGWTSARRKWELGVLVGLFILIYIGSLLGPPPPNPMAFAISGNLQWLFVVYGFWLDQNEILHES